LPARSFIEIGIAMKPAAGTRPGIAYLYSLDTVPLPQFATQVFAPSKTIPSGSLFLLLTLPGHAIDPYTFKSRFET